MEKTLDIVFTSDIHGHLFPVNYPAARPEHSGLLNLAEQIHRDGNTLVLDGGDSLQGTPLSQYYIAHREEYPFHPIAEGFRAMGCDYFTLGNHDFNFGYEVLKDYLDAMEAQCLCANLTDLRGELPVKKDAVHVLENGLRIGLTGIVTDHVMVWEQPQNLADLRVTDAFEAAEAEYAKLKDQCDICICIYHGGFEEDLTTGKRLSESTENVGCRIMRELGYDLLLTGHQHMAVEGVQLNGTYAVQPPANAAQYLQLHVEAETENCGKEEQNQNPAEESGRGPLRIASTLRSVGAAHAAQPYGKLLGLEEQTQLWLDDTVGTLEQEIVPQGKLEAALQGSRLADLFNEVQLAETGADFSCTSLGNEPVGLTGHVSMREICGAYLFANTLVVLEVDEPVLRAALERCASYFERKDGQVEISDAFLKPKIEHYNYDFYAGLCYEFDLTRPVGQRVTKLTLPDGAPLGEKKYRLVTSNYRATGTGGYESIGRAPALWRGMTEMPDLVAAYIRRNSPLTLKSRKWLSVKW